MKTSNSGSTSRLGSHLVGWIVYPLGDLVGQLIVGEVNFLRAGILMLAGGLIYRLEIPAWFKLIDSVSPRRHTIENHAFLTLVTRTDQDAVKLNWLGRTVGAMAYFNPVWIARHMMFIMLATTSFAKVSLATFFLAALSTGSISFLTNLPLSFLGNYLIQVHLPLRYRFLGSALFTTLLTIKYAIEYRLFN